MRKGGLYRPEGAKWYVRKRRVLSNRPINRRRIAFRARLFTVSVNFATIFVAVYLAIKLAT